MQLLFPTGSGQSVLKALHEPEHLCTISKSFLAIIRIEQLSRRDSGRIAIERQLACGTETKDSSASW
jgi:hypothetical protein